MKQVVWGSNERDRRDREAELAWGHSGLADLLKQAHASSIPDLENDWERIKGREDAEGTDTKDGNVVVSSKEGRLECESVSFPRAWGASLASLSTSSSNGTLLLHSALITY